MMVGQEQPSATRVHIALNVRDLSAAVTFYTAFLGCPPHKMRPGYANFAVAEPALKLALNEFPIAPEAREGGPLSHLGFEVGETAQVEAAKSRLQAAGLATFDEADTTCCFARQDKIWVHDPDGNAWEIYVVTDDLPEDTDHDHAGHAVTPGDLLPATALSVPRPTGQPTCCA